MGAIFGMVGVGDTEIVRAMGHRLGHRGVHVHAWSPAADVYLGQADSLPKGPGVASSLALDACPYPAPGFEGPIDHAREKIAEMLQTQAFAGLAGVRGPFTIAHWDAKNRELQLAVDHFQFKDLYYCFLPSGVAFASEYKAFFAVPAFTPTLDTGAIHYYLTVRWALVGRTFLNEVKPVRAGTLVRIGDGRVRVHRYWTPTVKKSASSLGACASALRRSVFEATERQTRGLERVGIALSGGIDSAIAAAVVRQVRPDVQITAYSVGYDDTDPEILGAKVVAKHLDIPHRTSYLAPEEIPALLYELVWLMEDISGREEGPFQLKLAKLVRGQETTLMFGMGADRLLGGMPRHKLVAWAESMPSLRGPLMEFYQMTQSARQPTGLLAKAIAALALRGGTYPPPSVSGIETPVRVDEIASLNTYLAYHLRRMTSNHYSESLSASYDYIFRSPFLDPDTADLALSIAPAFKIRFNRQKIVLRRAFADLLPPASARRGKSIQRMQHNEALSDVLQSLVARTGELRYIKGRRLVQASYLDGVIRREAGTAYPTEQLYRLWTLVNLEIWLRQFIEGRGRLERLPMPEPTSAIRGQA